MARITAIMLIVFLASIVYVGIYGKISKFSSGLSEAARFGILAAWVSVHYLAALASSSPVNGGLRRICFAAGLQRGEITRLLRSWFVVKNWHIPFVDILAFIPFEQGRSTFALELIAFLAFSLLALPAFGSMAFSIKYGSGAALREDRNSSRASSVRRLRSWLYASFRFLFDGREAVAIIAVTLALEAAGISDLVRNRPRDLGEGPADLFRWRAFYSFCATLTAQAAMALSYLAPLRYFRLLPVSFARYLKEAFLPIAAACALAMGPALAYTAAVFPGHLALALLYLAAFAFSAFCVSCDRAANRISVALGLFFGCCAASVLEVVAPIIGLALLLLAATAVGLGGRKHFLFDEVP